jgi:hypothetical protein
LFGKKLSGRQSVLKFGVLSLKNTRAATQHFDDPGMGDCLTDHGWGSPMAGYVIVAERVRQGNQLNLK